MLCLLRRARITTSLPSSRPLSSTALTLQRPMPTRPKAPPDSDLEESYLKGSGPGGQKINKTNSAVQIKHIPTGIVVKCQATRSRAQNRKQAREILAQRLDDLTNGQSSRAGIVGAVKKKRADSAAKKSRRKYKKLDEEKEQQQQVAEAEAGAQGVEEKGHGDGIAKNGTAGEGMDQSRHERTENPAEDEGGSSQTSCDASPNQPAETITKS